jgi:hypothetical protein
LRSASAASNATANTTRAHRRVADPRPSMLPLPDAHWHRGMDVFSG